MITYVNGNLFESPAKVLVNTVNTDGAMGKGLAKNFKTIYPEMFKEYQHFCEKKLFTIGKLWLYKTPNKWILNFPTKTTWRQPSKIEYIEKGLEKFVDTYIEKEISSIAFPPLGCGNGGLDWDSQVRPIMEKYLCKLPIDIFVYLKFNSNSTPEHFDIKKTVEWLRSEPDSLSFFDVWNDLNEVINNTHSLSTFNNSNFFVNVQNDDGIKITIDNNDVIVPIDKLTELWEQIRTYGFSTKKIMPRGLEELSEYLIILLSQLPYCRLIKISDDYKLLKNRNNYGIQWLPPSLDNGLFNNKSQSATFD